VYEALTKEQLAKVKSTLKAEEKVVLTTKKSRTDDISCWDYLEFNFVKDLLEKGQSGKSIKLEDLGGIHDDQTLAHRTK
jgi:hypothetical protein